MLFLWIIKCDDKQYLMIFIIQCWFSTFITHLGRSWHTKQAGVSPSWYDYQGWKVLSMNYDQISYPLLRIWSGLHHFNFPQIDFSFDTISQLSQLLCLLWNILTNFWVNHPSIDKTNEKKLEVKKITWYEKWICMYLR